MPPPRSTPPLREPALREPALREPTLRKPTAWVLRRRDAEAVEIWGLAPTERLQRSLARAGCERIEVLDDDTQPAPGSDDVVLVRADAIFDDRVVAGLVDSPGTVLYARDPATPGWGGPVAACVDGKRAPELLAALRSAASGADAGDGAPPGLRRAEPADVASAYDAALRKSEPLFVVPASAEQARRIEGRLFAASYKGVTDLITKWLWPRPAAAVTRFLARRRVTPNTVTAVSWVLTLLATVWFAQGHYAAGLAAAWLMTFLDTVDGKLARVTLTSSPIGHVLDHGLDIIHPPFWYLAWGVGLAGGIAAGIGAAFAPATAIVVVGYVVGRLLEGLFLLAFQIETHSWRPVDSMFRTITARRNPNLVLLTVGAAGGRPDLGMLMVAAWTLASLAFHCVRLAQAFAAKRRGESVTPWDEEFPTLLRQTAATGPETASRAAETSP